MSRRISIKLYGGLAWILTFSFLLTATISVSYASQDELDVVRQNIKVQGRHWSADENRVSRLSITEKKMRLGYLDSQEPNAEDNGVLSDTSAKAAIPAHFDWRNVHGYNYVTNIKDQGNCGSCWAFSSTAALESHVLITKFTYLNLSEQILVSCDRKDLGCGGGWLNYAANFIRDKGLPAEQYYPYTATNGVCASAETEWWRNTYKIVSWHYVGSPNKPNLVMIKKALVTYGPLVTTFRVYSDFLYYSSSVYQYTSGDLLGGHAVVIVGYDDAEQYFIVKNSWGIDWGESGYFRIGYSELSSVVEFGFSSIAYLSDRIHEWFNQFGLRTW